MTASRETLQVEISALHANGYGIAHLPGRGHIYVPFAFPGQRVSVTNLSETRSGQWQATLAGDAPQHCQLAARCGGCLWPGVDYALQVKAKADLFTRAVSRLPEVASLPMQVHAAPQVTGYRSRMHLHANFYAGVFEFGFYAKATRDLMPVTDCTVASAALQNTLLDLAALRAKPFAVAENFGFGIELVDLVEERRVMLTLYSPPARRASLRNLQPVFSAMASAPLVQLAHESDGSMFRWQNVSGVQMYTRAGCFQQVNRAQSDTIRDLLRIYFCETGSRTLLDLFSGSGNYSLPFAGLAAAIRGYDDSRIGIEVANYNLQQNGITNAEYTCADAADALRSLPARDASDAPDFVILDPARFGIGREVPGLLKQLGPRQLALVSNRTQTFTIDARYLLACGFRPEKLHLVDCFPFTPHWNIVSLWRNT